MKRIFYFLVLLLALAAASPALAQTGGPEQPAVHIVQRGETMFSIARQYGVSVEAVAQANGIADPRLIYVGQRLLITGATGTPAAWVSYVVRPGETLESIAGQYGLAWHTVAQANRLLNPHRLSAGQVLRLPMSTGRTVASGVHAVQTGETLTGIAFHYQVPLWQLMEVNGIANPALILPGQWLLVPGQRPSWMPAPFTAIELSPLPVRQGQALLVTVHTDQPVALTGTLFDRQLSFFEEDEVYYALVGVHALTEPGLYELNLAATDGAGGQAAVSVGVVVVDGGYTYERIDVPNSRSNLLDPALVAAEQQRLAELQGLFTPIRRWHGPLSQPVESSVSSYFGTRRSYNGGPYTSYHAGLDFNVGGGAPVHAPADGTVVLAEPLAVRGNAIMIDHGWGVLSGYWHLSSIEVTVGQEVHAGDVIGRVGSTGLSTGPHLHWEMWVGGVAVDGRQWLAATYPWVSLEGSAAP